MVDYILSIHPQHHPHPLSLYLHILTETICTFPKTQPPRRWVSSRENTPLPNQSRRGGGDWCTAGSHPKTGREENRSGRSYPVLLSKCFVSSAFCSFPTTHSFHGEKKRKRRRKALSINQASKQQQTHHHHHSVLGWCGGIKSHPKETDCFLFRQRRAWRYCPAWQCCWWHHLSRRRPSGRPRSCQRGRCRCCWRS